MLAPRKTLWSTPSSAVDHLHKFIPLQDGDCVCDVGCGDGRVIFQWAERYSHSGENNNDNNNNNNNDTNTNLHISFLGIDIDSDRIQQCQTSLEQAREAGTISSTINIRFVCANALQSTEILEGVNIFFLYLIPRGLKLFHPILLEHRQRLERPIKVATYMAKLPGETVAERALCTVEHQPGAEWPLYFYNL